MILYSLLFAAGIVTLQYFSHLPSTFFLLGCGVSAGICVFLRYWWILFFVAGLLWATLFAFVGINTILSQDLETKQLLISGTIVGLPQQSQKQARFNFLPDQGPQHIRLPHKIRLSWYYPERALQAGQRWQFTVRLKRPHGTLNPGGFDYEKWLFRHAIGATGYVRKTPSPHLLNKQQAEQVFSIDRWRQHLSGQIAQLLKGSDRIGFVQALVVGEKHLIVPEQWDVLRKTGTIHLFSISGLHIGLVATLVYFIIFRLWAFVGLVKFSAQSIAALSAVSISLFYAALAGFSIATVRAIIMLFFTMIAVRRQRHVQPFQILGWAIFMTLLFDPLAVLELGFWLSFSAVLFIIYALSSRRIANTKGIAMLKMNGVTAIGLMPMLLLFFQKVSILSPLANLIAVPVLSFVIVPLALFATVLLQFHGDLAVFFFHILDICLQQLFQLLSYFSALPFVEIQAPEPDMWVLALALLGTLLVLMPRGLPGRYLGIILLMPLFFTKPRPLPLGQFNLTLLDVGQGLSLVLQTSNHVMVYDTGARFSSKFDMGRNVILPFLRTQGVHELDMLIVSHGDNDHIGGAATLIKTVAIKNILSSVPERFQGPHVSRCFSGQHWLWDEVEFELLAPPDEAFTGENDNSCVLKITSAFGSALLPGDIENTAEQWLLKNAALHLKSDILIAPHHGSKSSSSDAFLQQVKPQTILIAAGYLNRFKHPHQDILRRYAAYAMPWLNTAQEGAIEVLMQPQGITVRRYRNSHAHFWSWSPERVH